MKKKYRVTKRFLAGLLEGLTYIFETDVEYHVGWVCENPIGGSPYVIDTVEPQ